VSTPSPLRAPAEEEVHLADRRHSLARHIGLDDQQAAIVIQEAIRYHNYVQALTSEAVRVAGPAREGGRMTPSQSAQIAGSRNTKSSVIRQCALAMYNRLDDQGDRVVREYILNVVRPNIKVIGDSNQ
jgi:hypothetical protein